MAQAQQVDNVRSRCVAGRPSAVALLVIAVAVALTFGGEGMARAGRHDLRLLNLCPRVARADGVAECSWISRGMNGLITDEGVVADATAQERYRSLMSELGVALAPQIVTPASTIGFAGFQLSAELATTTINAKANHWDGVEGVEVDSPASARPSSSLTTVGMFVRKGIWLPVPSMEVGAGFQHLLESQMVAYQGYLKLALHEGFQDWPLPSVAGRVGLSHVTGTSETRLDIFSFDLLFSKAFGVLGTLSIEPFVGGSYLIIKAKSGVLDATPGCDGYEALTGGSAPGPQCTPGQLGTSNDLDHGNYKFPDQDSITRKQLLAGLKFHFAAVSFVVQYGRALAEHSRDNRADGQGARDNAEAQDRFSLSAGFDY